MAVSRIRAQRQGEVPSSRTSVEAGLTDSCFILGRSLSTLRRPTEGKTSKLKSARRWQVKVQERRGMPKTSMHSMGTEGRDGNVGAPLPRSCLGGIHGEEEG